jgi:hypothetical protein
MVVVGSTGFGLNETRVEYMGATMYYRETWHVYLKDIAEVITETRSEDTRHMYYLIRRGEEQVVIDSLEPHLDDREWYQFQCSHPWKMTKEEYDQHDSNLCPACKDESDRRNRELNQMMTDYGMPL